MLKFPWECISIFRLLECVERGHTVRAPSVASFYPSMALFRREGKFLWLINLGKMQLLPLSPPEMARLQKAYVLLWSLPFRESGCPVGETWDSPALPVPCAGKFTWFWIRKYICPWRRAISCEASFIINRQCFGYLNARHIRIGEKETHYLLAPLNPNNSHFRKA